QTPLDKDQFSEVMINIIDNAIDSIPEESKGKIKISTEYISSSNAVKITISDNGEGIKVNLRDKIFEPFFTTKDTGTGLGLTISHKIIENHSGTIQVESDPETGTTFIITLPAE
ncbi:GHKL domain-containing protein, partial [Candidatus Dependentiae bacterium]|nr:GHKL domain-containing protein [Candidatus Dependentiae bacterium]